MGFTKERKKLEKLSEKLTELKHSDNKSLVIITDIYEQYSHTIRILKNKDIETFNTFYLNELKEIKASKTSFKLAIEDDDREASFNIYKDTLLNAVTKTAQAAKDKI